MAAPVRVEGWVCSIEMMIWSRIAGMGPPDVRCGDMVLGCASVQSGAAHIVSPGMSGAVLSEQLRLAYAIYKYTIYIIYMGSIIHHLGDDHALKNG
jgi:hypothetical protein